MAPPFVVFLRGPDLKRHGQIDDFRRCEFTERWCQLGDWTFEVNAGTRHAAALATPGYGLEVVRRSDGEVLLSGPMYHRDRVRRGSTNTLTVSGPDDMVWLARRLAHPEPATAAPPYNTDEHDVRTDLASTVLIAYADANAGPSALTPRRTPGLVMADDPLIGAEITGRARWQGLLEFLRELAVAGGIAFRVRKIDDELVFTPYATEDKSAEIKFSTALGNLGDFSYKASAPRATYAYIGGGGEGTARTIVEGSNPEQYAVHDRIEEFGDRRDTTDVAELEQEIATRLAEAVGVTGFSITPIDTPQQMFRTHYDLGDIVTGVVDGTPVRERITEVTTVLTPAGAIYTTPSIGTPDRGTVPRFFDRLRELRSRLSNLERR